MFPPGPVWTTIKPINCNNWEFYERSKCRFQVNTIFSWELQATVTERNWISWRLNILLKQNCLEEVSVCTEVAQHFWKSQIWLLSFEYCIYLFEDHGQKNNIQMKVSARSSYRTIGKKYLKQIFPGYGHRKKVDYRVAKKWSWSWNYK